MYLNNFKTNLKICNDTIGIITDVDIETNSVRVSFNVSDGIIDISINYFIINGNHASYTQFLIQNCYILTVHKTQGLTLNNIFVSLNDQIFSPDQAYVALSKCLNWNNIQIAILSRSAFMTDLTVINEFC